MQDRTDEYRGRDLHQEGNWPMPAPHKWLAYGGIVFNDKNQVLLREPADHFEGYHWTYAKGGHHADDHPVDTALREVAEETGHHPHIVGHVPGAWGGNYANSFYYLMHDKNGFVDPDAYHSNGETQDLKWANYPQAKDLISQTTNPYGRERDLQILDNAYSEWNKLKAPSSKTSANDDDPWLYEQPSLEDSYSSGYQRDPESSKALGLGKGPGSVSPLIFGDGTRGIIKTFPRHSSGDDNEHLSSLIAQRIGVNVPESLHPEKGKVILRRVEGFPVGAVEGKGRFHSPHPDLPPEIKEHYEFGLFHPGLIPGRDDLTRIRLLRLITGDTGGHAWNILYDPKQNLLISIDHEEAFRRPYGGNQVITHPKDIENIQKSIASLKDQATPVQWSFLSRNLDKLHQASAGEALLLPHLDRKMQIQHTSSHFDNQKEWAQWYDKAAKPAYKAFAREVEDQYRQLTQRHGINVDVVPHDPYRSTLDMMDDIRHNHHMAVLDSAVTGGHPILTDDQNNKFRAVHDYYGHYLPAVGFDRYGEEMAYRAHAKMFSPQALPALATETRGQNTSMIVNGRFPPQKAVAMPKDFLAKKKVAIKVLSDSNRLWQHFPDAGYKAKMAVVALHTAKMKSPTRDIYHAAFDSPDTYDHWAKNRTNDEYSLYFPEDGTSEPRRGSTFPTLRGIDAYGTNPTPYNHPEMEQKLRDRAISRLVNQWAQSSNDRPKSWAIQEAARHELGLHSAPEWPSARIRAAGQRELDQHGDVLRDFVRSQYDATQDFLREKLPEVTHIPLYRGWGHDVRLEPGIYPIETRPLSAWTTEPHWANEFSQYQGRYPHTMGALFPIQHIFATPLTGAGCLNEREIVTTHSPHIQADVTPSDDAYSLSPPYPPASTVQSAKVHKINVDNTRKNADWLHPLHESHAHKRSSITIAAPEPLYSPNPLWVPLSPHRWTHRPDNPFATDLDRLPAARRDQMLQRVLESTPPGHAPWTLENLVKNIRQEYDEATKNGYDERGSLWYPGAHRMTSNFSNIHDLSMPQGAGIIAAISPRTGWPENIALAHYIMHRIRHNDVQFTKEQQMAQHIEQQSRKPSTREKKPDILLPRKFTLDDLYHEQGPRAVAVAIKAAGMYQDHPATAGGKHLGWSSGLDPIAAAVKIIHGQDPDQVLTGHKRRSFRNNILLPNDPRYVTVDSHTASYSGQHYMPSSDKRLDKMLYDGAHAKTNTEGNYAVLAQPHRILGDELGILPNVIQATNWVNWRKKHAKNVRGEDDDFDAEFHF